MEAAAATPAAQHQKKRTPHPRHRSQNGKKKTSKEYSSASDKASSGEKQATDVGNHQDAEDAENGDEFCFICTEPVATFAVLSCNHRTCHLCALRLRSLYKTRNCAYCKTEQDIVVFTKDPLKPFEDYTAEETPFVDKELGARFEDKQIQQDTVLLLQYNCPEPDCKVVCDKGWSELKRHVKKAHDRMLCDICTQFKKIFPHEHTLYTPTQLHKHFKLQNKDESGFSGHPECEFCRISFYGGDELYEHCRDKHEQCHICVRHGYRNKYYPDYDVLEKHFKKDHHLCPYRECLEKKFVVFDDEIDLQAHEVEAHNANARRINVNFEYAGSPARHNDRRTRKNKPEPKEEEPETYATPELTPQDFPRIGSSSQPSREVQTPPVALRSKGKHIRKPKGFGSLSSSENWPQLGVSAAATSGSTTADPDTLSLHTTFLRKVKDLLHDEDKMAKFRELTTAYRGNRMNVDTFVNDIAELCNQDVQAATKILKGVEDLMDNEEKKGEIMSAWRVIQTIARPAGTRIKSSSSVQENDFPALAPSAGSNKSEGHGTSSRVLVIKGSTTRSGGTRTTGKSKVGVLDRVASVAAASTSTTRSSLSSSRPGSPTMTSFPQPRLKQNTTAWAGSDSGRAREEQSRATADFPSLPRTAAQKHPVVLGMRQAKSNGRVNAWNERSNEGDPVAENTTPNPGFTKKKGKKEKQVLFRVGL